MNESSDRLRQARTAAGFDRPADAAERFGWNVNTYKSNENGNAPFSFKRAKLYAEAFGVSPEWLYDGIGSLERPAAVAAAAPALPAPPGNLVSLADLREFIKAQNGKGPATPKVSKSRKIERRIPVVGEVAAGLWREAPQVYANDVRDYLDMDVAGYERANLRALRVSGPSMNLFYPEGRYVVFAHPAEAGLRAGDHVVVERHKADLVELTLKEFDIDESGRISLIPRSSHPDFQQPIVLRDGGEHDQTAPQIIGVVVADYARRERPTDIRR